MPIEPRLPGRIGPLCRHRHAGLCLAAVMLAGAMAGCGPRAPLVGLANRGYSAALRTAANTKSTERLARAREKIDRDHAAGMIHSEEYAFYGQIIALAEVGRWQEAEQLAVRFRRGQRR